MSPEEFKVDNNLLDEVDKVTGSKTVRVGAKVKPPSPQPFEVESILDEVQNALSSQESGGNTRAVNPRTAATGQFQVLPSNIRPWTKTYLGRSLTPSEFIADPEAQRKVFRGEFGKYLQKALPLAGGDKDKAIRMAAAGWYGGEGNMRNYDADFGGKGNEPSFREYTSSVLGKIRKTKPAAFEADPKLMNEIDSVLQTPFSPDSNLLSEIDNVLGKGETPQDVVDANAKYLQTSPNQVAPQVSGQVAPQVSSQVAPPSVPPDHTAAPLDPQEQADVEALGQAPVGDTSWGGNFNPSPADQRFKDYAAALGITNPTPADYANFDAIEKSSQDEANRLNQNAIRQQIPQQVQTPQQRQMQQSPAVAPQTPLDAPPTPRQVSGKVPDEGFGQSLAGNVAVDLRQKPKGMSLDEYIFRSGLQGVAGKYDLTPQEIDRAVATYKANGDLVQGRPDLAQVNDSNLGDYVKTRGNSATFQVTREQIAAAKGNNDAALADFKNEQTDSAMNAALRDPLATKPTNEQAALDRQFRTDDARQDTLDPFVAEAKRRLMTSMPTASTTDADVQDEAEFLKRAALSDADRKEIEDYGKELGKTRLGQLYAGAVGSAANFADFWNGMIGRPLRGLGFNQASEAYMQMSEAMRRQSAAADSTSDSVGKGLQVIGSLPLDLTRMLVLSRLPGGAVAGFAVDSGLQSAGRDQDILSVAGNTIKGAALGKLFGVGSVVEKSLGDAGFRKLVSEGAKIGTVTAGTFAVEKLSGATNEEAAHSALLNALFDIVPALGNKALGKVFRVWENNKSTDAYIGKDGQISVIPKVETSPDVELMAPKKGESAEAVPESPITRRQQVNELSSRGFTDKEIDNISSTDAKEIIDNDHTPADWKMIQKGEPESLGLQDKLEGKKPEKAAEPPDLLTKEEMAALLDEPKDGALKSPEQIAPPVEKAESPNKSEVKAEAKMEAPKTESVPSAQPNADVPAAPPSKALSSVGKSIEAKTIEADLTKGFEGTAEYDKITIKDQAEKAANLINTDFEKAKKIVSGEEKLPSDLRAAPLITAMENLARKNNDIELLMKLADSPLVAETSVHAQEMRLLRERQTDSPVKLIQELAQTRQEVAQRRLKKTDIKDAVKAEVEKLKTELKKTTPKKAEFAEFIKKITCN